MRSRAELMLVAAVQDSQNVLRSKATVWMLIVEQLLGSSLNKSVRAQYFWHVAKRMEARLATRLIATGCLSYSHNTKPKSFRV
jgi:hypothetical protein